jgi:hypothetical protein
VCCFAALQDKASVAAAQVPQLLLLPPQEVSARLEALSQSMKVGHLCHAVLCCAVVFCGLLCYAVQQNLVEQLY